MKSFQQFIEDLKEDSWVRSPAQDKDILFWLEQYRDYNEGIRDIRIHDATLSHMGG